MTFRFRDNKHKGLFTKGYIPNWSNEIFTINQVTEQTPIGKQNKQSHFRYWFGWGEQKQIWIIKRRKWLSRGKLI